MKENKDVEGLVKTLKYKDANVRKAAIDVLREIKDKRVVEPLISSLHDENVDIRCSVIKALGEIKDKRAVEPLIKRLYYILGNPGYFIEKHSDIRCLAAEALGKIKDRKAVNTLINSLIRDEDVDVRWSVIKALGEIKDKRAIEPLIASLYDNDVTELTVEIIRNFKNQNTIKALQTFETLKKFDCKKKAKGMALKWWLITSESKCHWCENLIDHNEGYLVESKTATISFHDEESYILERPKMICENCFDKNPDVKPYAEDKFYRVIKYKNLEYVSGVI